MELAGVLLSVVAMFAWGFGDFFIQRGSRLYGAVESLFIIGFAGMIALLPFTAPHLPLLLGPGIVGLLAATALITLLAGLIDFIALRDGKLAVIEPLISLELPLVVIISTFFLAEILTPLQYLAIAAAFLGMLLAAVSRLGRLSQYWERGALLAIAGAVFLALTDIFTGVASQRSHPILTIWAVNVGLALSTGLVMLVRRRSRLLEAVRRHPGVVCGQFILDNAGWLAFAAASTLIPISIALTISEGYVLLAVLLGIVVNRERLRTHQYAGVALGMAGVLALALLT